MKYKCEICEEPMSIDDHEFSDICSECLEQLN